MKTLHTRLLLCLAVMTLALPVALSAQDHAASTAVSPAKLVSLLDESGFNYTKLEDGLYEIPGTGKNYKEFSVHVALSDEIVLVMTRLADRAKLATGSAFLAKMLELNHHFDSVKLALADDMLYVRLDNHLRVMDATELKYMIEQVANAADEAYPQIQTVGN